MSFKDLNLKSSYHSKGKTNIAEDFLDVVLEEAVTYDRCTGFFSSSVFEAIIDGITAFSKRCGKIRLIVGPQLSEEDVHAIELGYRYREKITDIYALTFSEEVEKLEDKSLKILYQLVKDNILEIKIAVDRESLGIYHDKLGILTDVEGNQVLFIGSANVSLNAYQNNYEKIRVFKNWELADSDLFIEETEEFSQLWNNTNEFYEVMDFQQTAQKRLLEIIQRRKVKGKSIIQLRDYQEEAIQAWINNKGHGFFVMATGTGKTFTALYAIKRLMEEENQNCFITVLAPYKHLIAQWSYDIEKVFPEANIIHVSSDFPEWPKKLKNEVRFSNAQKNRVSFVISTINSFLLPKFMESIKNCERKQLLIVDEAHRFNSRDEEIQDRYSYMLGLSATPYGGKDIDAGNELMNWFGGQVFDLPIEKALKEEYLVPYQYHPIFLESTSEEEESFKKQSQIIASCFKNGKCINQEKLNQALRNRLRIIATASSKFMFLGDLIEQIEEKDHFIVYCGDGRLLNEETGEEQRYITEVQRQLYRMNIKSSKFTAEESMEERLQIIDSFNKQKINALTAIRCLDEGINIPSIKSALILASNDNYREFVQRRGRILRKFPGKEIAHIYDVILLPSYQNQAWAKIELRRYFEYARLAINWNELKPELDTILEKYKLNLEDIQIFINDFEYQENDDE